MTYSKGDKVFIATMHGCWDPTYNKGVVSHVTPSGLVDVLIGAATSPTRFRSSDGRPLGDKYSRDYLDNIPYNEREAELVRRRGPQWDQGRNAVWAILAVRSGSLNIDADWSKSDLTREISALEDKLATARAAVDMIP